MITKNPCPPELLSRSEPIYECVIFSTSLKADLKTILTNIRRNELEDYEVELEMGYTRLMEKIYARKEKKGYEAIYNLDIELMNLYSGVIIFFARGEGIRPRD